MLRPLIATILLLGSATSAFAEEAGPDTIVVTARAAQLYRVQETTSGKLPTEPLASSQAITVITEQLIKDQGARDAQDLYRNISGVSLFSYAGVTARGFRQQENFYDGLRGDPYIGFSVPQLFNIQRVEFLKGPAGMLYGQTAPGGLFNYVTKKPSDRFAASVAAVAGTGDRWGGQAEITGPLADGVAARAGAFFESRDVPRTWADSKSTILDGGLTLGDDQVSATVQALHIDQDLTAHRLRGVPVDNAGNFLADRRWNHNEPTDFLNLRSDSVQAVVKAQPTTRLAIDIAARYIDATEVQQYHEPIALIGPASARTGVAREFRDQFRNTRTLSLAGNAVWAIDLGPVATRLLAGADYSWERAFFDGRALLRGLATPSAGLPCPLTFANPVYRACSAANYALPPRAATTDTVERTGGYALAEATIGPVILTGGVRRDSVVNTARSSATSASDTTYRAGLVWRIRPDVSLFAQYATSFEPQAVSAQDPRAGGPFAPTSGNIVEGGLKTAFMGGRIQSSISAYRIVRRNLLQSDPRGDPEGDGINNFVAFGEVTSKGVDVDLAADLTRDWVVTLAYGYNDTRITRDNGRTALTNAVGQRFANAPEHKLGFWTRYQFPAPGIAFALGGDYVSERRSLNDQRVKPYIVFDASVILTRGLWNLLLRVDNLLDKTYAASGFSDRTGHFPGEPRSAFVEVTRKF